MFVNILATDDKCFLVHRHNLRQPIEMLLSQKQKVVPEILFQFLKSALHFKHFQKKMTIIANIFAKLGTLKNVVKLLSKKSCLRGHFLKQHGKGNQTLLKPEPHHLYRIYSSLWRQMRWKKSLLVISKILGLFVKTLTAGHKYSLLNREILKKAIQMQLSK